MTKITLASSSPYRKELLKRLVRHFDCVSPSIEETPLKNELPENLVKRLSAEKAKRVSNSRPDDWVIGSDQVAVFGNEIIGKPGCFENAKQQLQKFSGQKINFLTGVYLINQTHSKSAFYCDRTVVEFQDSSSSLIEQYLKIDKPFDCAGSFKVESVGPVLFNKIHSDDPTGLQGLPLISLAKMFSQFKINLLDLT